MKFEFDLHGLTLVEAIREYPEQAAVIMQRQAMELSKQTNNIARDKICPHRDTWTIIGSNGEIQYKIPACIKS